jgi:hypothetical protein
VVGPTSVVILPFWLAAVGEAVATGMAKAVISIISTVKTEADIIAVFLFMVFAFNQQLR